MNDKTHEITGTKVNFAKDIPLFDYKAFHEALLNAGEVSEVKVHDPVNDPVNDILEILRSHSDYSYKQIAETIGKSEATVKRGIAKLKSLNKIRRIGSDKSGHWEIIN